MPFSNVPEHLQDKMHKCVVDLKDQGKDEESAVAICYASIVEGKAEAIKAYEDLMSIKSNADELVIHGDSVKALGDGRVGGYLVRYSDASTPDLAGDYFTKDTDFGHIDRSDVLYHHGLDTKIGKRVIGDAQLKADDIGIWAEAQLKMRDEYERMIYKMAQAGKLSWSSGTASHRVERKSRGKAQEIVTWPLGLDASLTPTPAEPRNVAMPIKSLITQPLELDETPQAAQENRDENQTAATVSDVKTQPKTESKKMSDEVVTNPVPQDVAKIADELKTLKAAFDALKAEPPVPVKGFNINSKTKLGDDEIKAYANFIRTGDQSAIGATKASNAVDMQEGTNAEGGYAVPTGHYQGIIAKRNESMIATKLGIMPIPGKGLTVNVPIDDEADGEFVSTNEEAAFDVDTPALNTATMTLVKYTKEMLLSYELLEDEDSKLMAFLDNWVGRGMAKTHNSLLVTAAASGTALKTFASATAIAAGELEPIIYNSNVTYYLDDTNSNAWIMRPSTYNAISQLGSTSLRWYAEQVQGSNTPGKMTPTLLGYPVYFSEKAAATAASAKDVYFGNWSFMGYREAPGFTVLRDPYSNAHTGRLTLRYFFRVKYLVLQTAAIGYGVHPSA